MADLTDCLPAELRGPHTTIRPIAAGQSGARVYRVEAEARAFVLKVAASEESLAAWQGRVAIHEQAAAAGVAPAIVHVDESRRAVVMDFVTNRSFPAWYADPQTHDQAIAELGRTLRRIHELPVPAGARRAAPHEQLAVHWKALAASFPVPAFAADVVSRVLDEPPPPAGPTVMCHNDVNPTNLVFDGAKLLLVDWETAAPNDALYDLASVAVFLRMDEATCRQLLAAYGAPGDDALVNLAYQRRLVAALCGTKFLVLARAAGHAGATGTETLETAPTLLEVYMRLRAHPEALGTADGRWAFGLALMRAAGQP